MTMTYPFTEQEIEKAADEWGCNCGPSALAFALQIPIDKVRDVIPGFADKGYTSPTMMKAALANLGALIAYPLTNDVGSMFVSEPALVRIQWGGPWCAPGVNPKWAYRQTHWIATWIQDGLNCVFDCNGGAMVYQRWTSEIVPMLTGLYSRADGTWFPTHIWRVHLRCPLTPAPGGERKYDNERQERQRNQNR